MIGDIFRTMIVIQAILTYPGEKYVYFYDYRNKVTYTNELFNNTSDISKYQFNDLNRSKLCDKIY